MIQRNPLSRAQAKRLKVQQEVAQLKAGRDGLSDENAAAKLGISRRTLTRWRHDPAFLALLEEASKAAWDRWQIEFEQREVERKREWDCKCREREERAKAARRRRYLQRGV